MKSKMFAAAAAVLFAVNSIAQPAQDTERPDIAPLLLNVRTYRDIAYVPGGHERQKLDLFLPALTNHPLPVIVWVHGGGWMAGNKSNSPAMRFARRGYAVASINYRLSQHAVFPAQIEDCKTAIRWLRAHAGEYNLDPNRFGAWGASAGGHLVALLATTGDVHKFDVGPNPGVSSRVQAVVDFFGPADLLRIAEQSGPNSTMKHDAPDSPESKLIGGTLQENKQKARDASPITYVNKDAAPMLLVHGDADPLVPLQQSKELCEALKKAGADATLHIVRDGGHGTGFGPDIQVLVGQFFDKHLKGVSPNPAQP